MPELETRIAAWRQQMLAAGIQSPVPLDELESHLREDIERRMKSGLGIQQAFEAAARRLGDHKLLKKEFAKVRQFSFRLKGNDSLALNIISVWFVLMGLKGLSFLPLAWILRSSPSSMGYAMAATLATLLTIAGFGIFHRSNFWRCAALALAAFYFLAWIISFPAFAEIARSFMFWRFRLPADYAQRLDQLPRWQLTLLGTRAADFRHVIGFLTPFVLAWACYHLTRPSIRALFHRDVRTKTV